MKTLPALAIALLLAACGQTGPLRLPEPRPAAASTADAEAEPPKTSPAP